MKGMGIGLLEEIHDEFMNSVDECGFLEYENLVRFTVRLRENEFDSHLLAAGQNGVGKSMFALDLCKRIDPDIFKRRNIIYAFNRTEDFIAKLAGEENRVIMCDEINAFFNYRQSMTKKQVSLFNTIEIARANRNVIVSCCRDARRINNNYRNGKVQICVWLIDRFKTDNPELPAAYAMVFVANPVLEHDDKFGFDFGFQQIENIEEMRMVGESLPTFAGYLAIDNVRNHLTTEELDLYKVLKKKQMVEQNKKNMEASRQVDVLEEEAQQLLNLEDEVLSPGEAIQ